MQVPSISTGRLFKVVESVLKVTLSPSNLTQPLIFLATILLIVMNEAIPSRNFISPHACGFSLEPAILKSAFPKPADTFIIGIGPNSNLNISLNGIRTSYAFTKSIFCEDFMLISEYLSLNNLKEPLTSTYSFLSVGT